LEQGLSHESLTLDTNCLPYLCITIVDGTHTVVILVLCRLCMTTRVTVPWWTRRKCRTSSWNVSSMKWGSLCCSKWPWGI